MFRKIFIFQRVLFISLFFIFSFQSIFANLTHIWPESGLNENVVSVHTFGSGFSGTTIVKLIRTGSSDINGININVVSGSYLTCDFNLVGSDSGLYTLIVETDTLKSCFTVNTKVDTPYIWKKLDIDSGEDYMNGVTVSDGNNDGVLEIYGANADHHIYQFKWDGSSWNKIDIGSGEDYMNGVTVGDGNNDGELEIYGANRDHHIYQFKWDGSSWNKIDIGSGDGWMYRIIIGDGDNDGVLEIYGANYDHHIYQFKWDGSSWNKIDIGSGDGWMLGIAVGDGDNDGVLKVYGANMDRHIYQFKWDGSSWNKIDIGSGDGWMLGIAVSDGDNDGVLGVYSANMDHHIYQFKWDGSSWNKTDIGSGEDYMNGVTVGDGNNDGVLEVYGANRNHHIYQFKAIYTINITHIWPESGLNENIVSVHAFGLGFSSSLIVKLIRTGSSDINGINVNVVSGNYLICDFNLLGSDSGVYSLIIGTDTLKSCFMVNTKVDTPYIWQKSDIGSGESWMNGISVGDGNNDGELEIYGANRDHHIYQFKWDGSSWQKSDIGSG
ncbi:hypothetical protein DRP43_03950, partial [candidate division TA06 bacterium]